MLISSPYVTFFFFFFERYLVLSTPLIPYKCYSLFTDYIHLNEYHIKLLGCMSAKKKEEKEKISLKFYFFFLIKFYFEENAMKIDCFTS